jgi:membrane protein implicated in regulation of membrane protease activity
MPWWGWIVLGAVLLSLEVFLAADFFLVFFGSSAIVLGLIGVLGWVPPIWLQWLLFAALAVTALVIYRRYFRETLMRADAIVDDTFKGHQALVRQTIESGATGQAELSGTVWTVRNLGTETLEPGDHATVAGVQGLTLLVRRSR